MKIPAMMAAITAIPPTTPPTMAPMGAFFFGGVGDRLGVGLGEGDGEGLGDGVELELIELLVLDVDEDTVASTVVNTRFSCPT